MATEEIIKKEHMKKFFIGLHSFFGFSLVWKYKDLLWQIVRRNVQTRYKGTMIGLLWLIITPLIMLAIYTFVFSIVFQARWGDDFGESRVAFALLIFCGITVFNIFSESISGSVGVVTGNPNYAKKVIFPLEVLPVSMVFSSLVFGLVSLAILLAGVIVFLHNFSIVVVCLPFAFIPLLFLACGISWIVASLGVYFRDLPHIIGLGLQVLFWGTPIVYSLEMIPENFRKIVMLNPLTIIVEAVRHILIYNRWPDWQNLAVVTVLSLIIFQIGYFWFMKTKKAFADVL